MAKMTIAQAVNSALHYEMEKDSSVLVLGEDVGVNGGVFRITLGLSEKFGEYRSIDTPLAESSVSGVAIGLAVAGMRPVAEMQFMGFSLQGFDQIANHASRLRNRSRGRFNVPMVWRMPYGAGIHAPEHHSESIESMFVHTPGLKVVVPSTPSDAYGLMISAIRDNDPVVYIEPKKIYRAVKDEVPEGEYTVPIGKASIMQEGTDITVISWGAMMDTTRKAVKKLESEKVSVELLDLRTLSPLDKDAILESVKKTGRAVVVHEAARQVGLGAEISALITERLLEYILAPVKRVAGYDVIPPLSKLEKYTLPGEDRIIRGIKETMEF